eukprot:g7877.t1
MWATSHTPGLPRAPATLRDDFTRRALKPGRYRPDGLDAVVNGVPTEAQKRAVALRGAAPAAKGGSAHSPPEEVAAASPRNYVEDSLLHGLAADFLKHFDKTKFLPLSQATRATTAAEDGRRTRSRAAKACCAGKLSGDNIEDTHREQGREIDYHPEKPRRLAALENGGPSTPTTSPPDGPHISATSSSYEDNGQSASCSVDVCADDLDEVSSLRADTAATGEQTTLLSNEVENKDKSAHRSKKEVAGQVVTFHRDADGNLVFPLPETETVASLQPTIEAGVLRRKKLPRTRTANVYARKYSRRELEKVKLKKGRVGASELMAKKFCVRDAAAEKSFAAAVTTDSAAAADSGLGAEARGGLALKTSVLRFSCEQEFPDQAPPPPTLLQTPSCFLRRMQRGVDIRRDHDEKLYSGGMGGKSSTFLHLDAALLQKSQKLFFSQKDSWTAAAREAVRYSIIF